MFNKGMTLKTKSFIFNTSTVLCFINFIFSLLIIISNSVFQKESYIILLIITLLSLAASIIVQFLHRKTLSTEIIFFSIFLVSLSIQSIRIIKPLVEFSSYLVVIQIARVAIFFKYLAFLSLLGAALFSYGIKKQKIGSWLLLSLLGSLTISAIIHFNTGVVGNSLLPQIIYHKEESVIAFSLLVLTVLSFIKTGFDTKNREYIYMGISTVLLFLGLEIIFMSLNTFPGVMALISLILGFSLFLKSVHNITLWS